MAQTENIVSPSHYHIELAPDMTNYRFHGRADIVLTTGKKVQQITLNILDLAIKGCKWQTAEKNVDCAFTVQPDDETLDIHLPEPTEGDIRLTVDYVGEINSSMAGFYRSTFTRDGIDYPMAVTQFQESDARRAFPCMDHPVHKATFELVFVIDDKWTVMANTPVRSETMMEAGKRKVEFEKTPRMSTYLLFFGVGGFTFLVDDLDRRVRAAILPGMEKEVRYGLAFARKSLHYCEKYYDIPFPLPKLDLVAVPDFAFGAMENWGAITFRENLLLYDPRITDVDGEERICEVIAHEMVHQWFGNLVTPSDWKYLWLNESFATYFGYGVVDHYHPDWRVWDTFVETQTEPSMARDGLTDTSPIEIPGGHHVVINVSTAPIIYSKGGSILRQIEEFIGQEAFQAGLRNYLKKHAYDCATSPDLWEALEAASGKPVSSIMKRWVEQAGHPLLTAERHGNILDLHQERFSYMPAESKDIWPVPLVIRIWSEDGSEKVITRNFDDAQIAIEMGSDAYAYKINDRQAGFYRVAYQDPDNWNRLCEMIRKKALSPLDRWGIINDRYALLKAGRIEVKTFLSDMDHYAEEDHPLPLSSFFSTLFDLYRLLENKADLDAISKMSSALLEKVFAKIGYLPRKEDDHAVLRLRNQVLWLSAFFELPGPRSAVDEEFERLLSGGFVNPDISRAVMQAGAFYGDEKVFHWLTQRYEESSSEHERLNVLRALGCFCRKDLIEKVQAYILHSVPQKNKFLPVAALAANPFAADLMWDWFAGNIDELEQIHPIIFERIVAAIVPVCGLERSEEVDKFLVTFTQKTDLAESAIRMSLEKRNINVRLRNGSQSGL